MGIHIPTWVVAFALSAGLWSLAYWQHRGNVGGRRIDEFKRTYPEIYWLIQGATILLAALVGLVGLLGALGMMPMP